MSRWLNVKCAKQVCGQGGKGVSMTVTHVCLACFNMPEDVSTWYVGRHGGQKVRAIRNEGHAHELAKCDDRAHHHKIRARWSHLSGPLSGCSPFRHLTDLPGGDDHDSRRPTTFGGLQRPSSACECAQISGVKRRGGPNWCRAYHTTAER